MALAFKPVLGPMLSRIYGNPQNRESNQSRLEKILQFWATKEVFDQETIRGLEDEMAHGSYRAAAPPELPAAAAGRLLGGRKDLILMRISVSGLKRFDFYAQVWRTRRFAPSGRRRRR